MTGGPWLRTIDCLDATGRDRGLVLSISDTGQLRITAPPPGTALIPLSAGDALKEIIGEAQRTAVELALGLPPAIPTTSPLQNAQVFHVMDAHGSVRLLGIGISEGRVLANGPTQWQAADDTATAIGAQFLALGHELRQQRRRT